MTCSISKDQPYCRCPRCKSVDIQEILEDRGTVHLRCRTCRHQFWTTNP